MKDNELIQLFSPIILSGLIERGFTNVGLVQADQPTQQGAVTTPTVYFFKLMDKELGFIGRNTEFDTVNQLAVHTESQYYETTFQCNALVIQNPLDINGFTASDIVKAVSKVLQSDNALATLNSSGVGVLRISEIRNIYFKDDRGQFEASPSFDFILVHQDKFVSTVPIVDTIEINTYEIN